MTTTEKACQMIEAVSLHKKGCRCEGGNDTTIDADCITEARKTKVALAHLRSLEER